MKAYILTVFYNQAVKGMPLLGTPEDIAEQFTEGAEIDHKGLIRFYSGLGGAAGFLGGVSGLLLMPLTLPANLMGVALMQLHMAAAFAVLGGRDLTADLTRDLCIQCLLSKPVKGDNNAEEKEIINRTGLKFLERAARALIEYVPRKYVLRRIRQRGAPFIGGIIGASTDAYLTSEVGRSAKAVFLPQLLEDG